MKCPPREITRDEAEVIRVALERARAAPVDDAAIGAIPALRVVGVCGCGCASVDFDVDRPWAGDPLARAIGKTHRGGEVGVLVWGRQEAITGLEIFDLGAGDGDIALPVPSSIRRFPPNRVRAEARLAAWIGRILSSPARWVRPRSHSGH